MKSSKASAAVRTMSTKDVILKHLHNNKGREIPFSEIEEVYNFKPNRISNAIKELEYKGKIIIERRPLKRGKYVVIKLVGDEIKTYYVHDREIIQPEPEVYTKETNENRISIDNAIQILTAVKYSHFEFKKSVLGYLNDPYDFIFQFIQPLQYEVGIRWADGRLTTAIEHIITQRLEELIRSILPPNPFLQQQPKVFLVPVEDEHHVLGLLSIEYLLRSKKQYTVNIGRTLPITEIIEYIDTIYGNKEAWLFISVTLDLYLNNLRHDLKVIRESIKNKKLKIVIGGQGLKKKKLSSFPEADFIITSNNELKELIEINIERT